MEKEYVTYCEFGACGDGKTNDIDAIIKTHEYANKHHLPVRADAGKTYYIGVAERGAVVQTETDWTGAFFVIDDSVIDLEMRYLDVFSVRSYKPRYDVTGLTTLKKGQSSLGVSFPEPAVVVLNNSETKRFIREGGNRNNGSEQTDVVIVDREGTISPDTALIWDYERVTSAFAFPIDESTLTIRGGTFTTIANTAECASYYHHRGIGINRSHTIVRDITHYVTGEGDHGAPYSGFLHGGSFTDVIVQDCVFTAHKTYKKIGNAGTIVPMGSYDFNFHRGVNILIKNCKQTTDILDGRYWGIMATNFCKNITLEDCTFSRFDAHQGAHNVTIRRCTLGHQCLNAIGGGLLRVEDSTLYGYSFINLRPDYGSTWEGDVIVKNCTWIPRRGDIIRDNTAMISGRYSGFHNFGYECYMPANISIDGLHVKDNNHDETYDGIYLLGNITEAHTDSDYEKKVAEEGYPYHLIKTLTIKNFSADTGKKWHLSPNAYMYRDLSVIDEDV